MTENFALTHLYHPGTGAKVSIPLDPSNPFTPEQAKTLILSVDNLIAAGFTVNIPGLEDGENIEQIGFIVRREINNDDKTITPVVDLYPVQGNFRILGLYLNTDDDVKNFETACKINLNKLPLYDGTPIERGKKPQLDKYVVALKSPAKVVYKHNPKWEGDEDKKHPKRIFVRWDGLRPANSVTDLTQSMTYEQAREVKTPGGAALGSLDAEKLHTLSTSKAANVTDEMRQAAKIILKEIESEGV
jgi:hypothetical protein